MSNTYIDLSAIFFVNEKYWDRILELIEERDEDADEGFDEFCNKNGLNIEFYWPGFKLTRPMYDGAPFHLYSDGDGNIDHAAEFGAWMVREGMLDRFELRWAMYGSDVGGGALVIDNNGERYVDSEQWIMKDFDNTKEVSDG